MRLVGTGIRQSESGAMGAWSVGVAPSCLRTSSLSVRGISAGCRPRTSASSPSMGWRSGRCPASGPLPEPQPLHAS